MALSDIALVTLVQAKAYLRLGAVASTRIDAEYVGVGDDADVTFDLDNTPIDGSLQLYVDGTLQVEGTDYTISTATITFTTAPASPKPITARYTTAAAADTFESYDDLLLDDLIESATKKAEDYTGRAFIQRTVTEYHHGEGIDTIKLYRQPVISVTSVAQLFAEALNDGDGATVAFTLDNLPTAGSVEVYVDGVLQTVTTDYTVAAAVITFVAAPADETKITAKYTHTILPITEYVERPPRTGRLYCLELWKANSIYKTVYVAGYGATRAATQALVPDAVNGVLLILANAYENRVDLVKSEAITGVGSVTYDIPSMAKGLLNPYRTKII